MAVAAVALIFYFRLTKLEGSSPYELFLLLNIVLAILVNPRALFAAVVLGLAGAQALIAVEGGRFFSSRYWTLTIAYSMFLVRFPVHHGDHITRSARPFAADA
jgi:hypothetical protein